MLVTRNSSDSEPLRWDIVDDLLHLREWGTTRIYPLPPGRGAAIIGAARNAWLRITAPSGRIAEELARLVRTRGSWTVQDLHTSGGVRLDGAIHSVGSLSPGSELEIGGIRLIAESRRLVALREILTRLIGWAPEHGPEVDLAMRAVRLAALYHQPLLICGSDGDIVSAARLLHRQTLGAERPFIVCHRRRPRSLVPRQAIVIHDPRKALKAATGGTLCMWRSSQLDKLAASVQWPVLQAQLVVCTRQRTDILHTSPLVIPPPRKRADELHRIIEEYLVDACAEYGGMILPADREWIRRFYGKTLARIEFAARRIVALRSTGGSVRRTARLLGMGHSALSEWVARRNIPDLIVDG
jgi:hypothetical protein